MYSHAQIPVCRIVEKRLGSPQRNSLHGIHLLPAC